MEKKMTQENLRRNRQGNLQENRQKSTLENRLSEGEMQLPDGGSSRERERGQFVLSWPDVLKSFLILLLTTSISALFYSQGFSESNIIMVYILGVLITAVVTTHQIYSLVSSLFSVIVFNFLFTEPRYTLLAYEKDYPVTFLVMFVAAFLTSSLAVRLKKQAKMSAQAAYRTQVLLETNQMMESVRNKEEIIQALASQIIKLLGRDVVIYPVEQDSLKAPVFFWAAEEKPEELFASPREKEAAEWVLRNNRYAGAAADFGGDVSCQYLPIHMKEHIYGVIGIEARDTRPDAFEQSILLSILSECAMALENDRNRKEKEEAAIMAEKEQLRANLLRSISHDLRTPLTSISGNASNLLSNGDRFDEDTKRQLYGDIYDDAMWLINLVENLLSVTRIEEGRMNLHVSAELIEEVIAEALQHIGRRKEEHRISVSVGEELLLVRADARLIVQVLINLLDNAIKYTPAGSEIRIEAWRDQTKKGQVAVRIADNGPGLSQEAKEHAFEMFYSGAGKIADSRRSLGLGLFLCRSIINAHGGEISVSDNQPGGAVFQFTLPVGEVKLNEQSDDFSSGR